MSAVEGNHRVQGEKVTALVPRVENRIVNAKAVAEYDRILQRSGLQSHLKRYAGCGFRPFF